MGLEEFDPANYELDNIPQRLRTLELCVVVCHAMLKGKVDSTPLNIDLGTSKISEPNLRLFVDTVIDAGLVANRTLLNFMGIKLNNNNLINEEYALTVTKFGLPLTPVADAVTILSPPLFSPAMPADELRRIWVEVLNTASKSTAHFTEKGGTIRVARLGFASYATSLIVRKYFYQALGKTEPDTGEPHRFAQQFKIAPLYCASRQASVHYFAVKINCWAKRCYAKHMFARSIPGGC